MDLALGLLDADRVVAIINPENVPSRRVAKRLGMEVETETTDSAGRPIVVYGRR